MRRAIVHIGMPRTGSTSLQEMMTRLRPALARVGVLYPALGPPGAGPAADVNHQCLGEALDGRRPGSERAANLERLGRALAETQAETVLLSYEDFAVQRENLGVPEVLRQVFSRHGFALEVAIVVKPQIEQLNSAYAHRAQLVREDGTFRDHLRRHGRSARYDYAARIAPWHAAAEGRVRAVPLRAVRRSGPLLARLLQAMGLEACLQLLPEGGAGFVTNRSPGPFAVEASRRLHALGVHRQVQGHTRQIGHVLDGIAQARGLDGEAFRGEAAEMRERVEAHYADSNTRFAHLVWGSTWEAEVAAAPPRPSNELAGRSLEPETDAEIEALVAGTIARFGWRPRPAWRRIPANFAEHGLGRIAQRLGRPRWRVP